MIQNKELDILKEFGFSDIEISAYITCLSLGTAPASSIAKEMTIKRTTVYVILKTLASKGLIRVYFKGSVRVYTAVDPKRLSRIYEKKVSLLNDVIPYLSSLEKRKEHSLGVRFIESVDELKDFYEGILEEYKNKEYYVIGNVHSWKKLEQEFFSQYRHDRAAKNIKTKLILTSDSRDVSPDQEKLLRETKYLPERYTFKSTVDIYKDKVLIVSPELTALAVVIDTPVMTDVFNSIFEILWDTF